MEAMYSCHFRVYIFLFFLLLSAVSVESAVLLLKDGGTLEGELLNPDELSRKVYRIKTASGLEMTLDAGLVDRIQRRERDVLLEYNAKAPLSEHTIENHLYWATWCNDNQLPDQAKLHWEQILELDPDHADARTVLGYIKNPAGVGWILQRDKLENRGFVLDRGRWRTAYQIEVEKILENQQTTESQWQNRVRNLCRRLPNSQAEAELRSIRDPAAFSALRDALIAEQNPQNQVILLRLLAEASYPSAIQFTAGWSIRPDGTTEDVRQTCLEELQKRIQENPEVRQMVIAVYRDSLRSSADPSILHLAARALEVMEGYEAVPELIGVLVVTKTEVYQPPSLGQSFGPSGSGITWGQPKPITKTTPIQNQAVLTALQKFTGVNYGFNQSAWREWYRQTQRSPSFNLRRN